MDDFCYEWRINHRLGDKNKFSEYFSAQNFTWRLVAVSTDKHYIFLEHFGYLTFDVFTDYKLVIEYTDGEREEKEATFSFGGQLDFGIEIQSKEISCVWVNILSAARCYESKKDTPYAGMVNLGSTCYLNSLIQTLFHIRGFVQELFKQEPKGKTLEMQKLFYQLEKESHYVDTLSFANAFKLNEPIDDQQDIQEFFKVLLDDLEKEAKDTPFFKYIEDTFYGTLGSLIECEKGCQSERVEKYNDIQLVMGMAPVEGSNSSLEDSLQAYINVTHLEEPNLYNCEKHGYVRATKKDYFKTFSPVLFFQIKRFNMDYETGEVYKINDYFSFPTQIDLSPFTLDHSGDNKYSLYSINVHLGDGISEGHYYSYILKDKNWYKFNDCYVTRSSEREAVDGTFGGVHDYKNKQRIANAYYLVYIRDTEKERLLKPTSTPSPPTLIKSMIERDQFLSKVEEISIYTDKTVKGYWGPGATSPFPYYYKELPILLKMERSQSLNLLKLQAKKSLDTRSIEIENFILFSIEESGKLVPVNKVEIVGDLSTNSLFITEKNPSISEENTFVLFVKTEKAMDQPYNLKFVVDVKSVHVIDKNENILQWISTHHKTQTPPLIEHNGSAKEITEESTFADIFEENSGVIVLNAGIDFLKEYFLELSRHKVLTGYIDSVPFFYLWINKQATKEDVHSMIEEKMHSNSFSISEYSEDSLSIRVDKGYAIIQTANLQDKTENVNFLQKTPYIVPEKVSGVQLLKIFGQDPSSCHQKTKVVKTYFGSDSLSVYKLTETITVNNRALIVLQQISKKTHAEAQIKYDDETIGHPFFIDVKSKRTAMETKRKYRLEQSSILKYTQKKQAIIDNVSTVKKTGANERFVFVVDHTIKWKILTEKSLYLF